MKLKKIEEKLKRENDGMVEEMKVDDNDEALKS